MSVSVVSIGRFENGSFGVFGLPIGGAELFRLDCAELREMVAKAYPALADYSRFTYADRADAEAAIAGQVAREEMLEKQRQHAAAEAANLLKQAERSVLDLVLATAEIWAAGRVSVRVANDREVIVGRWDAPMQPGFGKPTEVRMARRAADGSIVLVDARDSYRMLWA